MMPETPKNIRQNKRGQKYPKTTPFKIKLFKVVF